MNNLIEKIIKGFNLEEIIAEILNHIYSEGPVSLEDLEILTYVKYYHDEVFSKYENEILQTMGLFYKETIAINFKTQIFEDYKNSIADTFGKKLTPMQADIYYNSITNKCFSFSAGTSTGKSFVFNELIKNSNHDVVIIVPSRALINEYIIKLNNLFPDSTINVLPFIDIINTGISTKNIFVVTPERAKELFKYKNQLTIDYFLFDEAQLGDENTTRGIIFDSIVRRTEKEFPNSKKLFAQPFISNPEIQLSKNNLNDSNSFATNYNEKNIGQMYISFDNGKFYNFGLNKCIMGFKKINMPSDPVEKVLKNNGTVLIYTSKSKIYDSRIFIEFKKYVDMCEYIFDEKALFLIDKFKKVIGASDDKRRACYSEMIDNMKRGIVLHHGSLPLQARIIIEEFTKCGFCKICFATSTLVQGINMPFDLVWLDLFQASKPLEIKNLIGRAGRSTLKLKFDYGLVVIKDSNKSEFRTIMNKSISLKPESLLDSDEKLDDDLEEYKDAIKNNTINDEFNLTQSEIEKISSIDVKQLAQNIVELLFERKEKLTEDSFLKLDKVKRNYIYEQFQEIYKYYLNNRELSSGEKGVIATAIKILMWQIQGKTFRQIVGYRYANVRKNNDIKVLVTKIKKELNINNKKKLMNELINIEPNFTTKCMDIPNKEAHNIPLFSGLKAYQISYDLLVFDTYDYVDKIIGFKLRDIFYATFMLLYNDTLDIRAKNMSLYIKYGTIDSTEILLLRYGYSFDTIEWLKKYIENIDEVGITFKDVEDLTENQKEEIGRYLNKT